MNNEQKKIVKKATEYIADTIILMGTNTGMKFWLNIYLEGVKTGLLIAKNIYNGKK